MNKYRIGDVLIRSAGGIRVIVSEEDKIFFLAAILDNGTVGLLPHFKSMVQSNLYKKLEV